MKPFRLLGGIFLFTAFIMLTAAPVLSHPAGTIDLDFDNETGMLKIKIFHSVRNESKHFIEEIKVYINKKLFVTQIFNRQTDNKSQEASYILLDANQGDVISVNADCNYGGSKKKDIKVKNKEDKNRKEKE